MPKKTPEDFRIELKVVGELLGINNRTLRYVVESAVIPGIEVVNRGRGSQRLLSYEQAFQVSIVALMYQQGIRSRLLRIVSELADKYIHSKRKPKDDWLVVSELAENGLPFKLWIAVKPIADILRSLKQRETT